MLQGTSYIHAIIMKSRVSVRTSITHHSDNWMNRRQTTILRYYSTDRLMHASVTVMWHFKHASAGRSRDTWYLVDCCWPWVTFEGHFSVGLILTGQEFWETYLACDTTEGSSIYSRCQKLEWEWFDGSGKEWEQESHSRTPLTLTPLLHAWYNITTVTMFTVTHAYWCRIYECRFKHV